MGGVALGILLSGSSSFPRPLRPRSRLSNRAISLLWHTYALQAEPPTRCPHSSTGHRRSRSLALASASSAVFKKMTRRCLHFSLSLYPEKEGGQLCCSNGVKHS
ncbi:unnamed protein product [Ectocarpus sp. 13 AM-2016]